MKKPLVSIIIPYYRSKKYFKETYNSILKQNYKNIEIIIIFDDPNKMDLKFLKKIINYKNTKILVNKKNLGAGYARNKGIQLSKGKYLAFIDSDDIWNKGKLLTQMNFMLKYNYPFTHTSYDIINHNNKVIGKRIARKKISYNDLLKSCDIGLSTVILKKVIIKNIKFPNIKTKEDFVLWLEISKKFPIIGLNKKMTKWRKLNNSLSSNTIQKLFDGFKVYNKYMQFSFIKSMIFLFILSFKFLQKNYSKGLK